MKTPAIMRTTLLALFPGAAAWCLVFGPGAVLNLLLAVAAAILTEMLALGIRRKPLSGVRDGTAILTGALLGLCLPPMLPAWLVVLGVVFAVIFGKHLYGGTGHNVFNPAMIGFAMLIVSFPLAMSTWPAPGESLSVSSTLAAKLGGLPAEVDAVTGATPLDAYRFRDGSTNAEFFTSENSSNWHQWLWINLAFLAGGFILLHQKIVPWQTPVAMLATLGLLSLLFYDGGSSASLGSPLFHLFSGATMLGAFFIITDPVTCPGHRQGLLVFGAGVGLTTFIIRTQGAYPEGIAFGVLLMNAVAPLIDHIFVSRAARERMT